MLLPSSASRSEQTRSGKHPQRLHHSQEIICAIPEGVFLSINVCSNMPVQ